MPDYSSCTPATGHTYCNYSDSVVKLDSSLNVKDYFSPGDQGNRISHDFDMGSGGALVVPGQSSGGTSVGLLVQGGKEGDLFLVNRTTGKMGGYTGDPASDNVQQGIYGNANVNGGDLTKGLCFGYNDVSPNTECGMWSSPAWWNGGNTTAPYDSFVFVGPMGSLHGSLDGHTAGQKGEVIQYTLHQTGITSTYQLQLAGTPATTTDDGLEYPGVTPVISAASATGANAVLWYINNQGWGDVSGTNVATLRAYDATELGTKLWTSNDRSGGLDHPGPPIKFTVPTVANGRVYIGGYKNLSVYGLP